MKIGEYEQMMAYLTRPAKKPQSEQITPKPKPYTEDRFKQDADLYLKGFIGGFPQDEMLLKLQSVLDKAVENKIIEPEAGLDYYRNRKQELLDFAKENPGETLPGLNRENFYAGGSLEQYGSKIKNLYLKGTSTPKINEALGFEKDRSTTIDEFIKSMKSGKAPIKITADELSRRPNIVGTNITGKPGERKAELSKWVKNFEKENGRLPSMQEAKKEFDYSLVKKTGQTGEIKYLPSSEARSMGGLKPGQEDIIKLSKDSKVRNMFRTGEVNAKQIINHVKNILEKPDMSDDVAGGKLHALAEFFSGKKELTKYSSS